MFTFSQLARSYRAHFFILILYLPIVVISIVASVNLLLVILQLGGEARAKLAPPTISASPAHLAWRIREVEMRLLRSWRLIRLGARHRRLASTDTKAVQEGPEPLNGFLFNEKVSVSI